MALTFVAQDLLVGAKKAVSVTMTIPPVADLGQSAPVFLLPRDSADIHLQTLLELTWEVSVRRANVGVSGTFVPEGVKGPQLPEEKSKVKKMNRKRGLFRRRQGNRSESADSLESTDDGEAEADEDGIETTPDPMNPQSPTSRGLELASLHTYERLSRGGMIYGVFRFHGHGGKVVFIIDNSYSKTRAKRVSIKLVS